jgi:pyruvate,water dikinase
MAPSVVDLAAPAAARPALVGGKAANLHALIAAGFAVPDGFCVTTDAYVRVAGVAAVPTAGHGVAERGRAALLAATVPDDVAAEVAAAYAALGPGADGRGVPVAVRSSATAEDLPTASFAGQQDTFLHVVGIAAVLDAVRCCWASLWTDRAVSYRAEAGIDHAGVALAVVVQRMVDARTAGVLFTADPVSGRRTRTVIDAASGLGEAVVSGAVNPDHVVVDGDGTVVEHRVGDKAVAVRGLPGGGVERVVPDDPGAACLSDDEVRALAALGRRVEAHFGGPQDVEWAIDGAGALWLTQSRPITTLYPQPPGPGPRAYVCVSLAQGLTGPITPMGLAVFRIVGATASRVAFGRPVPDPLAGPAVLHTVGARAFVDVTPVLRNGAGRLLVSRVLDVMETRTAVVLRGLARDPAFAARPGSARRVVAGAARVFVRFRIPPLVVRSLVHPAAGRRHVDRVAADLEARAALPAGATPEQRLDHVERLAAEVFPVMPRTAPVAGAGFAALGLARWLAGPDLPAAAVHEVLRGLPHNVTTAMDLDLWALAVRVRADPASAAAVRDGARHDLPPVLARELAGFLARHGHRAVAEIDVGVPRWSDDPAPVLGVLANYLRLDDDAETPAARFARGAREADAAVADVVARVRRRSRARAVAVAWALGRTRALAGMRETHKDLLVRLVSHARAHLTVLGAELADRGRLDDAADVFFLDLREVRSALGGADHRTAVAARRAEHAREQRRRHVPRVLLADGTEPEALAGPPPDGALVGVPASAGVVTAPARVVLDPAGAHLEPGEVLVCPSTDPGWTPLFLTAGGLVMEMGGANSHGAVVAREYGIPAVVGVPDATRRLHTSERVTVDGAAGAVAPA